ncbi:MAG: hypothetical protein DME35_11965 [Verrucomicrobia bacterium]|nr:MAG: hypothetical protein DME35_11965 [Verrucomicrobiota bacterium]
MKPFAVAGLPPDELNSFLSGTHSDPFRILGPHRMGDDLAIRAFRRDPGSRLSSASDQLGRVRVGDA